eukprot:CAMPEP_0174277666 /NCGR_PEP_ID=MMETSP0439-20130205/61056_1 /TAXON_ID=0 /ORGANISM="Stereomyxa ramosa, Strain Chinc5" /LENGTH=166 /DNA_ID=CAMNT_0015370005 /DNA_START=636 /DNA_END=1136 /DNA_ORIENTATION=+
MKTKEFLFALLRIFTLLSLVFACTIMYISAGTIYLELFTEKDRHEFVLMSFSMLFSGLILIAELVFMFNTSNESPSSTLFAGSFIALLLYLVIAISMIFNIAFEGDDPVEGSRYFEILVICVMGTWSILLRVCLLLSPRKYLANLNHNKKMKKLSRKRKNMWLEVV